MRQRKTHRRPIAYQPGNREGVLVTDPRGVGYVLSYDDFKNLLGLHAGQYMPVTVGGLAVSAGRTLIAIQWDDPLS